MKKKILYTTSMASPQSGAYNMLVAMAKGAEDKGWDSVLVLPNSEETYRVPKIYNSDHVYTCEIPRLQQGKGIGYYFQWLFNTIRSIRKLRKIIQKEDVSIVHANEFFDLYAGIAAMLTGRKLVWHVRADLSPWPFAHWIFPRINVLLSDSILVVSKSVKHHMFHQQGIMSNKIKVIYDPSPNPEKFHPSVNGEYVREEFDINDNANIVCLIGKLSNRKGHGVLIWAAPKIIAKIPNTFFLIVGGELESAHHKQYARDLRLLTSELGVEGHVIFTGYRSDIPQIMATSDIITHLSTYPDPFPGVVLQGMAVGKPVIASGIGGPCEQIKDGESGILVEPANHNALAQAIILLLNDDLKRMSLGKAASERVKSEFSSEKFFQRLGAIYSRLNEK